MQKDKEPSFGELIILVQACLQLDIGKRDLSFKATRLGFKLASHRIELDEFVKNFSELG